MSRREAWKDVDVQCPFYRRSTERQIVCEGLTEKGNLTQSFRRMKDKEKHMGVYCCGRYRECRLYRMLMDKYHE